MSQTANNADVFHNWHTDAPYCLPQLTVYTHWPLQHTVSCPGEDPQTLMSPGGVPEWNQDYYTKYMNRTTIFYIMGAIQTWNTNYFGDAGRNFTINGTTVNLKNVESIVPALGYDAQTNAVLYDKDDYTLTPVGE